MIEANVVPMVIDRSGKGERAYDIYSLLLKERIIFLGGTINETVSRMVVAQLLYLNSIASELPINLYIQSPGGEVYSGLAIYDTMKMLNAPVHTYSVGFTGSMATFILSSGEKGKRFALPHSTIHMHPTGGGSRGYTEDVRIATREQERLQAQIFHLMGQQTGHSWQKIEEFFLRDKYLNAREARSFGLIDEIIGDTSNIVSIRHSTQEVNLAQ